MTTAIKKIGDKWEYDGIIFDKKSDAEKVKKSTEAGSKTALDESDFEGGKQRISMWVDEAIVKEFKILAHKRGSKYQTLMNEVLKEYVELIANNNLHNLPILINIFIVLCQIPKLYIHKYIYPLDFHFYRWIFTILVSYDRSKHNH